MDALIISGGAFDIDPSHYGEKAEGRIDRRDEERTILELSLARAAIENRIPVLGICGGMQVLAVACGGALIQDIHTRFPTAREHEQPTDPAKGWHDVYTSGILKEIYNADVISVNPTHHQAVCEHERYSVVGRTEMESLRRFPFQIIHLLWEFNGTLSCCVIVYFRISSKLWRRLDEPVVRRSSFCARTRTC